jgi:hypothetical protein
MTTAWAWEGKGKLMVFSKYFGRLADYGFDHVERDRPSLLKITTFAIVFQS